MPQHKTASKLTKYPLGSIRELFFISLPLMLSAASGTTMFFLDRLILARYSTEALDAATAAGMGIFLFHLGVIGIAAIAEVFVGQNNGAKKYNKLGEPVWQMLWFCLISSFAYIYLAFAGLEFLVPEDYVDASKGYYRWLMLSGPIWGMVPALAAFFIGQGKVKIVTYCVILGNIINLVLDILFVFGWGTVIPEMGVEGAAIATVLAQAVQVIILFSVFIKKRNREKYGTLNFQIRPKLMTKCLKVGSPGAIGHMLEIGAWTYILHIVARAGEDYVTVFAVGQGFFVLFTFAIDGLKQGVTAVASNMLGAKKSEKISFLVKSAIKLHLIFVLFLVGPIILYPELLVKNFLYASHNEPTTINPQIIAAASISMFYFWLYFIFDGFVWIVAGILTSAGKTMFVLVANALNAWIFAVIPLQVLVHYNMLKMETSWQVSVIYGVVNSLVFFLRYRSGKWRKNSLLT